MKLINYNTNILIRVVFILLLNRNVVQELVEQVAQVVLNFALSVLPWNGK